MATQEFYIDYFDKKYLDFQFPDRENTPHFQLADGDVGGTMTWDQDDNTESGCYKVISRPNNFPELALETIQYLRKPTSLRNTYQAKFSENASKQIGETGKLVLEEILALHNDLVTPKRS
jgi:hypothetical protein